MTPIRVLLFEDDYESMRDLKDYIEEELEWSVDLTADSDLLNRLSTHRFDLIILDSMIHPVSFDAEGQEVDNVHFDDVPWLRTGLELLRRLRRGDFRGQTGAGTSANVPVLILSAVAGYSVEEVLGKDVPFDGYVQKPFRLEDLSDRMRQLVGR